MSTFEFKDVGFKVQIGTGKEATTKTILSGINGMVKSGELVAIIGSSGAGKTTLLNVLSGRIMGGDVEGEILFNGQPRSKKTFKRDVAYVEQFDLLLPTLTARETIEFAADFRLNRSEFTQDMKRERVNDVLKSLRLSDIQNSYIGNEQKKVLSGGERKRVSIGCEIVTTPKMLMLDEPTSGLDSNSSYMIAKLMKEIAVYRNLICISSIHQPSSKIFYTFDKVILMVPGGVVFFGSTKDSLFYFDSIGYKCPPRANPADFLIDIMTIDYENEDNLQTSLDRVEHLKKSWAEYVQNNGDIYVGKEGTDSSNNSIESKQIIDSTNPLYTDMSDRPDFKNNWFWEFGILYKRQWIRVMRDKPILVAQFLGAIMTFLLVGFTFFRRSVGIVEAQSKVGLLNLMVINMTFPVAIPIIPVLFEERLVMFRERSSGSYRMSAFLISILATYIPISFVYNFICLLGVYFLTKLQVTAGKFWTYIALFFATVLNSLGYAFLFAALTPNMAIAQMYAPLGLTLFWVYGGVVANSDSTTRAISWIRFINYNYFSFMGVLQNEMNGKVFDCSGADGDACYPTGESVVLAYSLNKYSIWSCFGILLGMAAGYYILTYFAIRYKNKPKYILI
ncbi:ATP-binding cassette sub-family G member 8 [Smittium mucronatum]|uniref:ATP-binding cassette sub-family G member 8 n=1 Tax=Smittium mucronatum TaxID=133383 RepID=A0A1R0GRY3_9FUNG|nr:ATP-binding cassette sub-family G member 8 [Smittium mucronatum]